MILLEAKPLRVRYTYLSPEHGIVDAVHILSPGEYVYEQAFRDALIAYMEHDVPIPYADDLEVDGEFP